MPVEGHGSSSSEDESKTPPPNESPPKKGGKEVNKSDEKADKKASEKAAESTTEKVAKKGYNTEPQRHKRFVNKHLLLNDDGEAFEVEDLSKQELIHLHLLNMLRIRDNQEPVNTFGDRETSTIITGINLEVLRKLLAEAVPIPSTHEFIINHPFYIVMLKKRIKAKAEVRKDLKLKHATLRIIQSGLPNDHGQPKAQISPPPTELEESKLKKLKLEQQTNFLQFGGFNDAQPSTSRGTRGEGHVPSHLVKRESDEERWDSSFSSSERSPPPPKSKFYGGGSSTETSATTSKASSPKSSSAQSTPPPQEPEERIASIDDPLPPDEFRALDSQGNEYSYDVRRGVGYCVITVNNDTDRLPVHHAATYWVDDGQLEQDQDSMTDLTKWELVNEARKSCGFVKESVPPEEWRDDDDDEGQKRKCGAAFCFFWSKRKSSPRPQPVDPLDDDQDDEGRHQVVAKVADYNEKCRKLRFIIEHDQPAATPRSTRPLHFGRSRSLANVNRLGQDQLDGISAERQGENLILRAISLNQVDRDAEAQIIRPTVSMRHVAAVLGVRSTRAAELRSAFNRSAAERARREREEEERKIKEKKPGQKPKKK